ncbi:TPA: hypothetical protein LA460_000247 [Clostridium botulinum]|nr:hypothetical protein [Clostridium botulinum]HBJ1652851.1 hypothetical protein [Clostridium botulinum]
MKELEILENQSTRENLINKVEVLEKVKELLLLGNSEFATTKQVTDYYEVDYEVINKLVTRNKEELIENGLNLIKGKEIKEILVKDKMSVTNYRGYFEIDGQRFTNNNNLLFQKRTILNVGMLLRDSKVAKEIRSRLLDIEYESNNSIQDNGQTLKENIVNEIENEKSLIIQRVEAEMMGNYDEVHVINAKLFALKNKRIKDLENKVATITTHALDIIESRKIINRLVRTITFKEFNGKFADCWNELWSKVNYQLGINIKARKEKPLDSLSDEEMYKFEQIVRAYANQVGIDVEKSLSLKK